VVRQTTEFVDYLTEVFEAFGPITPKRMFGGFGIYHDDLMFGLVAGDVLYLKADSKTQARFAGRNLPRFEYVKQGKPVRLSFFAAPEEIFDDRDAAREWATLALEAALRSRRK
jgi:DNA transformation protein